MNGDFGQSLECKKEVERDVLVFLDSLAPDYFVEDFAVLRDGVEYLTLLSREEVLRGTYDALRLAEALESVVNSRIVIDPKFSDERYLRWLICICAKLKISEGSSDRVMFVATLGSEMLNIAITGIQARLGEQ